MKRRKPKRRERCRCKAWLTFFRRAAFMLLVLFVAGLLIANLGGEAFKMMDFVKEASSALADAAADAFGDVS